MNRNSHAVTDQDKLNRRLGLAREGYVAEERTAHVTLVMRDDVVRSGLETLLVGIPFVASVRSGETFDQIAPGLASGSRSILILSTAEKNWPLTLSQVLAWGSLKVLLLLTDPHMMIQSNDVAGTDGLLLQSELDRGTLARALTQVMIGEVVLPAALAKRLLAGRAAPPQQERFRSRALTDRELQTLRLLSDGLSNKQIGRRLSISEHGAKRLVASVLIKLDSPNRTSAVVTAIQEGLLP
ncbi:response regulator transcription factor [Actinomadura sp. SCN-SB]|uniref:helix-turn-helix transcriptional regulator n=1 Tax=Actinomadura sp. SCN-SB TaxID=3373092 RepID=UPI0037528698